MRPEVYEANLEVAICAAGGNQEEAVARAIRETADALNIPLRPWRYG